MTLEVPLSSLTTSVEGGKPIGLRGQSAEIISVEQYARISQVKVGWDFNTEIPKPPSRTAAASSRSDSPAKRDEWCATATADERGIDYDFYCGPD